MAATASEVWLNDSYVGYAQEADPREFELTQLLQAGGNWLKYGLQVLPYLKIRNGACMASSADSPASVNSSTRITRHGIDAWSPPRLTLLQHQFHVHTCGW